MANISPDASRTAIEQPSRSDFSDQHHPMSAALLQAAAQASARESSASPPEGDDFDHHSEAEGDAEHGDENGTESNTKRKKRSRACQACRGMKIRCLPVEGQEACKACSKVNRACVMPGPARKRQKTVHKVAELEKKIDALTKSLAAKNATANESNDGSEQLSRRQSEIGNGVRNSIVAAPTPPSESPGAASTPSTQARYLLHPPPPRAERQFNYETSQEKTYPEIAGDSHVKPAALSDETAFTNHYVDVIERGILSTDRATEIYERWKQEMYPYCPFVYFPEGIGVQWLRKRRPMVLLAILGCACGTIQPELQEDLMVELARQLADRVMFYFEKSIDLAQTLLIMPVWYGKHKQAKDLGFNQYIHSAVTMCLDLGLGKRCKTAVDVTVEEDFERRRLWLGCYHMAGSVTTVLRVPSLVKSSPYIEECLERLSKNADERTSDRWLCQLVRLNQMYEEISLLFHMDDPGSNILLSDTKTQYLLKMFQRGLDDWKKESQNLVPKAVLDQYYAVTSLYIHEIAMHTEHNIDDFRPNFLKEIAQLQASLYRNSLTTQHAEALAICVESMESAMTAFNTIDIRVLRGLPCLSVVWIAYVAVAMIRLHGLLRAPDSKYGEILLPKMHIQKHLDNCVARLTFVVSENAHSPAESFLLAFKKLRAWFALRNSENNAFVQSNEGDGQGMYTADKRGHENGAVDLPRSPISNPNMGGNLQSRYSSISQQSQSPPNQSLPRFTALNQDFSRNLPHQNYMATQPRLSNLINQPESIGMNPGNTSSLLDPNAVIDASTFDVAWDLNGINTNLTELNNFDVYMNDVGWMGYLM